MGTLGSRRGPLVCLIKLEDSYYMSGERGTGRVSIPILCIFLLTAHWFNSLCNAPLYLTCKSVCFVLFVFSGSFDNVEKSEVNKAEKGCRMLWMKPVADVQRLGRGERSITAASNTLHVGVYARRDNWEETFIGCSCKTAGGAARASR